MIPRDTTSERKDFFILAGLLLVLAAVIALDPLRLTGDVAVYLQGAKSVLRGERLFIDFYSDPLPIVFFLPSVWFSELAQLNMVLTLNGFLWLLTAGKVFTLQMLLTRSNAPHHARFAMTLSITTIFITLLLWLGTDSAQITDFAQREHLVILLWFPFLILRWLRWKNQDAHIPIWLAVSIGAWAAVGSCMKPHFLLIAFLPELYLLLMYRRWQTVFTPEAFAYVATGFIYPIALLLMPAEMKAGLFDQLIPAISENYGLVYTSNPDWTYYVVSGLFTVLIVCTLPFINSHNPSGLLRPIALATLGAVAVTLIQNKGWYYQFLPAINLSIYLMALIIFGGEPVFKHPQRRWRRVKVYSLLIPLCILSIQIIRPFIFSLPAYFSVMAYRQEISAMLKSSEASEVLVITTTGMLIGAAVAQSNIPDVGRYIIDAPIAYAFAQDEYLQLDDITLLYTQSSLQPAAIQPYLNVIEEDILRYQPSVIIIDNFMQCEVCPQGFEIHAWLEGIGFIGRVMDNYEYLGQIYGQDFYRRVSIEKSQ